MLLYAQPISKICTLTTGQVSVRDRDHTVELSLGAKPLELPRALGKLVLELVANRKGHGVIGHTDDHPWLFPGGIPGRQLSANRLAVRLKRLHIPPRTSRNTALMDLAADLPAKVLSDLLGISIEAAVDWTQDAGQTRAAYAAAITDRRR